MTRLAAPMCDVSRRSFLSVGAAAFLATAAEEQLLAGTPPAQAPAAGVQEVAPGVFFFEKDAATTGSNSGWVVLDDYVLVIDASFPSGARLVLSAIRAVTDKPIRFAFDTHHHGDHAYGNQVLADSGRHAGCARRRARRDAAARDRAVRGHAWTVGVGGERAGGSAIDPSEGSVAAVSVAAVLRRWQAARRARALRHGHTRGDALAWLPNQRVLFSGDVCVNGAYNSSATVMWARGSRRSTRRASWAPACCARGMARGVRRRCSTISRPTSARSSPW